MMGWVILLLLAVFVTAGLVLLGRLPRSLWEMTGAALLFGMAGYAWQGHPDLAGSPRDPAQTAPRFDGNLIKLRDSFGGTYGSAGPWITLSDGFGRRGETQEAVNTLVAGVRAHPNEPALWVALGNALVAHGKNIISPAAEYSFRRAMHLEPKASSAPYFYGLALARSGQYANARKIWRALAARVPEASPLHAELVAGLAKLNRILAGQTTGAP